MNDTIAVVSCVWQRPERLAYTLDMLHRQTHQDFVLWLIINNAEHRDMAETMAGEYEFTRSICHPANRGPYARLELMHALANDHDWFMTIDDDVIFDPDLLAFWWANRDARAMQGWRGFRFIGSDYWQRADVEDGEPCHYLWGSNLFIPSAAVADYRMLSLPQTYWQCDDLWLCYWANGKVGLTLQQASANVRIRVDGKDTYHSQHNIKQDCFGMIRERGWP
jgi:glycosyltransferase involved in cell wall biosynthesis